MLTTLLSITLSWIIPLLIITLISSSVESSRLVRWIRYSTLIVITLAITLIGAQWWPLIVKQRITHNLTGQKLLSKPTYSDTAILATISRFLMRDSSCEGGIIEKPMFREIPLTLRPSGEPPDDASMVWLVNASAMDMIQTGDGFVAHDLVAAEGISVAWVRGGDKLSIKLLRGEWKADH